MKAQYFILTFLITLNLTASKKSPQNKIILRKLDEDQHDDDNDQQDPDDLQDDQFVSLILQIIKNINFYSALPLVSIPKSQQSSEEFNSSLKNAVENYHDLDKEQNVFETSLDNMITGRHFLDVNGTIGESDDQEFVSILKASREVISNQSYYSQKYQVFAKEPNGISNVFQINFYCYGRQCKEIEQRKHQVRNQQVNQYYVDGNITSGYWKNQSEDWNKDIMDNHGISQDLFSQEKVSELFSRSEHFINRHQQFVNWFKDNYTLHQVELISIYQDNHQPSSNFVIIEQNLIINQNNLSQNADWYNIQARTRMIVIYDIDENEIIDKPMLTGYDQILSTIQQYPYLLGINFNPLEQQFFDEQRDTNIVAFVLLMLFIVIIFTLLTTSQFRQLFNKHGYIPVFQFQSKDNINRKYKMQNRL